MKLTQKVTPFLWFDGTAEAAAKLYVSLFEGSQILNVSPMVVTFELGGQQFLALNGGPTYHFTEAFSLYVSCEGQAEVDRLWDALIADGGSPSRCGWLKDKYGLSWQIIPTAFMRLMSDPDPVKAGRVRDAMMTMDKLDIAGLERAHAGA